MHIRTTDIVNYNNSEYGTTGGNDTQEKVFLLNVDEVYQYFDSNEERIAQYSNDDELSWWLRTPVKKAQSASHVIYNGNISTIGEFIGVDKYFLGVRPSIWVSI